MGIGIGSRSSSLGDYSAPNPNPLSFKVVRHDIVNNHSIMLVKYFGCTTFDGLKLLVLNEIWNGGCELDPHFLGDNHPVKARFEPNDNGMRLAVMVANENF